MQPGDHSLKRAYSRLSRTRLRNTYRFSGGIGLRSPVNQKIFWPEIVDKKYPSGGEGVRAARERGGVGVDGIVARTQYPFDMKLVDSIQAITETLPAMLFLCNGTIDGVGGTRLQAGHVETDSRNGRRACAEGQGQQLFIVPG